MYHYKLNSLVESTCLSIGSQMVKHDVEIMNHIVIDIDKKIPAGSGSIIYVLLEKLNG